MQNVAVRHHWEVEVLIHCLDPGSLGCAVAVKPMFSARHSTVGEGQGPHGNLHSSLVHGVFMTMVIIFCTPAELQFGEEGIIRSEKE